MVYKPDLVIAVECIRWQPQGRPDTIIMPLHVVILDNAGVVIMNNLIKPQILVPHKHLETFGFVHKAKSITPLDFNTAQGSVKDHIKNKIIVGENLHTALYALNIDHSPINKCDLSLYYELYDGIEFQEYKDYHAVFQNWLKEREREDLLEQMKQDALAQAQCVLKVYDDFDNCTRDGLVKQLFRDPPSMDSLTPAYKEVLDQKTQ